MKSIVTTSAWAVIAGVIIYAVLVAPNALMFQNPTAAAGLGLIGLGLCLHARKHAPSFLQKQCEDEQCSARVVSRSSHLCR